MVSNWHLVGSRLDFTALSMMKNFAVNNGMVWTSQFVETHLWISAFGTSCFPVRMKRVTSKKNMSKSKKLIAMMTTMMILMMRMSSERNRNL